MATIFTHPVVPVALSIAAGQSVVGSRLLLAGILLSMLPDLDVLAFHFHIPYSSEYGHRGFTHSVIFGLLMGAIAAGLSSPLRSEPVTAFLFASICVISHGVLDAMTNGGLGIAFFWPFDNERYFLPWQGIEVSPIGVSGFLSARGWTVILSELQYIWLGALVLGLVAYLLRQIWRLTIGRPKQVHPS